MSSTQRRNATLIAALLIVATSACAEDRRAVEIVVPAGTAEQLDQGETINLMPDEIYLRVGDTLRVRNEDTAAHDVGPYLVAAGTEFEITYGAPGRFEGVCPLSGGEPFVIEITE